MAVTLPPIEFYFDCSSPWSYLAFTGIHDVAARHGAEIIWKPIVVGGVFNKVNQAVYDARGSTPPAKVAYTAKDMQDWAQVRGIELNFPPACGHPVNSVKCMRGCIELNGQGRLVPFAREAFHALWVEGRNLGDDEVLRDLCRRVHADEAAFMSAIVSPALREKLRASTDELIQRGGFGTPTMFLGDEMYFGNDRLCMVDHVLSRLAAR